MKQQSKACKPRPSNYAGDSPRKKVARMLMWRGLSLCAQPPTPERPAFILCGEGRDVPVLDAMGVARDSVVLVDVDAAAVKRAIERYPGVRFAVGDIGAMATESASCAMLDFCGVLGQSTFDATRSWLKLGVPTCTNVAYGRDAREFTVTTNAIRSARAICMWNLDDVPRGYRRRAKGRLPLAAVKLLSQVANLESLLWSQLRVYQQCVVTYTGHKHPMTSTVFAFEKDGPSFQGVNLDKFDIEITPDAALWLADHGVDVGCVERALQLRTGAVAAYKAHRTRGTYDRRAS